MSRSIRTPGGREWQENVKHYLNEASQLGELVQRGVQKSAGEALLADGERSFEAG